MGLKIVTQIACDKCGQYYDGNQSNTGTTQRKEARECGQVYANGKDLCPECRNGKKLKK